MQIFSKLKQYYKYRRNWKKVQSRQAIGGKDKILAEDRNFYSQFIKANDLCFDIGANIGDKTDLFLWFKARVVAVEPQESCWRVLKRRFQGNENVSVEAVALAENNASRTLFIDRSHTLASFSREWIDDVKRSGRFANHRWNDTLTVPTVTMDTLIEKYGKPDFCKIDVEGFEFDVLQGLSQPVKTISLEFVTERIEASIKCIDYLSALGNTEYSYCLGDTTSLSPEGWVDTERIKSSLKKWIKK